MIKGFEKGKWYRYEGDRGMCWNYDGKMDYMLDGKPHLCLEGSSGLARFKEDEENTSDDFTWAWGDLYKFYECDPPIKEVFKPEHIGMTVYDYRYGKGTIIEYKENSNYPIKVKFKNMHARYTSEGQFMDNYGKVFLSFKPWKLPKDWDVPPLSNYEEGEVIAVWDDGHESVVRYIPFEKLDVYGNTIAGDYPWDNSRKLNSKEKGELE